MRKNGFLQGALCGALAVLLTFSVVSCGSSKNVTTVSSGQTIESSTKSKLNTIKSLIDEYYIGDVDEDALQDSLIAGYLEGLDDPYSVYYDKEETEAFYEDTSGEYSGVGAVLSEANDTGVITIVQVYEDSPAEKAGIKANDILYKVGDKEVTGIDLSEVVTYIKGDKGTKVDLTVLRGDDSEEITATCTRDAIEAQTVEYKMMDDEIGYLQVTQFDTVTYDQYEAALSDLESQGMKALVIDLRSNPGGSLQTCIDMLDLMLPEGLIVYTQDKNGEKEEYTSDEDHKFELPLAVLVNGYSASASEIFTGAIQDYGIGTIIGTTTYGKGVVQQIFDLEDGTCMKLTVAEYYTPNGRNINKKGITPDIEIEYEYDEDHPDQDNQLDKAVETVESEMDK